MANLIYFTDGGNGGASAFHPHLTQCVVVGATLWELMKQ